VSGSGRTPRDRPELYGIKEIADDLGLPDSRLVATWRLRGSHGMPRPDAELASGSVWFAETIEPWLLRQRALTRASAEPSPQPLLDRAARRAFRLAAVALEERPRPDALRRRIAELVELAPALEELAGRSTTNLVKPLAMLREGIDDLARAGDDELVPVVRRALAGGLLRGASELVRHRRG
jgi:hypothetical protein